MVSESAISFAAQHHPLEDAGVARLSLLLWIFPMLKLGFRQPLLEQDVWPVPYWVRSTKVMAGLWSAWSAPEGARSRSLPRALASAWWLHLARICVTALGASVLMELPPLMMGEILNALLEEGDNTTGWIWVLVSFLCVSATGLVISFIHRFHSRLGVEIRSALACAVYHQILQLGGGTCSKMGQHELSGFCSTLVGVDCERAYILCHFGLFLIVDFILIAICMPLLVYILGVPGLWGCLVLIGATLTQRIFMGRLVSARKGMQEFSDRRLAATQELLENIRSLKMLGLEQVLLDRICRERQLELARQKRVLLLRAVNGAFTYCMVHLCLLVIMLSARHGDQSLTLPQLFTALAFLNANRIVFTVVPFELAAFSEGLASLSRIEGFLRLEKGPASPGPDALNARAGDLDSPPAVIQHAVPDAAPEAEGLRVADCVFVWSEGAGRETAWQKELRVPQLEVNPGELVLVVGTSGGGKSSLCAALLGWMPLQSGQLQGLTGKVGFCPQEPWVLSGTVRENVLGHSCRSEEAAEIAGLWEAIGLAGLKEQVAGFPGEVDCEIGFKGLNLSGGQKARLALARALALQGAGAYILDDVLSSLDMATAEEVIQSTILGHLAGHTRVVTLNWHYEWLLPHAQAIVLVERGAVRVFRERSEFEATDFAKLLAAGREEQAAREDEDSGKCPPWIAQGLPADVGAEDLGLDDGSERRVSEVTMAGAPSKLYEPEARGRGPLHPSVYKTYFGLGERSSGQGRSAALLALTVAVVAMPDLVRILAELFLARVLEEQGATIDDASFLQFCLLVLLTFVLALLRSLVFMALARRSSKRVHSRVVEGVCKAPINKFFDVIPPGRLLNFCGKDMDAIDTLLPYQALEFLQDVAVLGLALLVCVAVFPMVLLVLLPCTWFFLRLRQLYVCSSRELMRMEATSRSPVLTMVAETIAGLPVVRAQKDQPGMYARFCALVDQNAKFFMHVWILMPWLALYVEQIIAVIFLAACVSALLLKGVISPALMAVALTNIMTLLAKVQITCRQSVEVEKLFTAVERLSHLLHSMPAEEEEKEELDPRQVPASDGTPADEWPSAGHIQFEGACLRYRPGLPLVLQDLSLEILPGKSVGLIGTSGSGKTSCLRTILRLAELERGRICIDGVDISTVPLRVLRERVASVPQEPLLLSGTLRRNLLPQPGQPDEDSRCWAMLDMVGLGEAVRSWPSGLDTEMAAGDEGALSMGQRQLLSLGRSLLRRAKVLCVDEATAHVDGPTDAALQRALLASAAEQRTTRLTIAHRLWTLRHCDEVLLLRAGSPTEVLKIQNPERIVPTS